MPATTGGDGALQAETYLRPRACLPVPILLAPRCLPCDTRTLLCLPLPITDIPCGAGRAWRSAATPPATTCLLPLLRDAVLAGTH